MTDRYSRQTMLPQVGIEGQQKLQQASVLLVGVGGLGSPIALYLAAVGLGRLGIIDADTVSMSNLQRQILYRECDIDKPKVACAKERLIALNSTLRVDPYPTLFSSENARQLVEQYDLVIDGCDNFATRYLINDTCVELGKPYVYGSIGEFHGQVSVFNYKGGANYRNLYPNEAKLTALPKSIQGVLGVVPAFIGSIQASEAIKIITGCGEVLRNKLYTIDLLTMQSQTFEIQP